MCLCAGGSQSSWWPSQVAERPDMGRRTRPRERTAVLDRGAAGGGGAVGDASHARDATDAVDAALDGDGRPPSVSDNPPVPEGWQLLPQSLVTPEMTAWALAILDDPVTYPMFSTATQTFGTLMVLARVEWLPPDFQNAVVHRGVTLYEPAAN